MDGYLKMEVTKKIMQIYGPFTSSDVWLIEYTWEMAVSAICVTPTIDEKDSLGTDSWGMTPAMQLVALVGIDLKSL